MGGSNGLYLDDTWSWDGRSWHEEEPSARPPARYAALGAYHEDRQTLVIFGGMGERIDSDGKRFPTSLNDTWSWEGSYWNRHSSATSPAPGIRGVAAYDTRRGQLVLLTDDGMKDFGHSETWIS